MEMIAVTVTCVINSTDALTKDNLVIIAQRGIDTIKVGPAGSESGTPADSLDVHILAIAAGIFIIICEKNGAAKGSEGGSAPGIIANIDGFFAPCSQRVMGSVSLRALGDSSVGHWPASRTLTGWRADNDCCGGKISYRLLVFWGGSYSDSI